VNEKLQDKDEDVRCAAVRAYVALGNRYVDPVLPTLFACLKDPHRDVRCAALYELTFLARKRDQRLMTAAMTLLVEDRDRSVKTLAAKVLFHHMGEKAMEMLREVNMERIWADAQEMEPLTNPVAGGKAASKMLGVMGSRGLG